MAEKSFTYEDLKLAMAEADKDARLEMMVDYIIKKLEDPETGCTACRKRIDRTERKVDRIMYLGGAVLTIVLLFGRDVITWILNLWRGTP
jgi:hypothetical protein